MAAALALELDYQEWQKLQQDGPPKPIVPNGVGGSPINGLIINGVILGFFCSPPINGVITTGFTRFMSPLIKHRKRSMKNYHKTSGWRWCFTNPPNKNSTDSKPWWKNMKKWWWKMSHPFQTHRGKLLVVSLWCFIFSKSLFPVMNRKLGEKFAAGKWTFQQRELARVPIIL